MPYGINGFGTKGGDGFVVLFYGAQRLTASMVSAHFDVANVKLPGLCSTPYGINGFGTIYQGL